MAYRLIRLKLRPPRAGCSPARLDMLSPGGRRGFTLIEILIIVMIMAILAATILPQLTSSVSDSKIGSLKINVRILRDQIQRYRCDHQELPPTGADNLKQLCSSTNVSGAIGPRGPSYPFGPYLDKVPVNPFTGSPRVNVISSSAGPPTASGAPDAGWMYRSDTGEIWADQAELIDF